MRLFFVLLFAAASLSAQSITGVITGTVFDPAGAVVPGAKITAVNVATQVVQATTSTQTGSYLVPALQPGTYKVLAEAAGFKKLIRQPITVDTSRTVTIDLAMTVGEAKTEVTVEASAPLVQQANASIQYGINQKAIEELPMPDENVLNVLTLMPGIVGEVGSEAASITTGYVMPGTAISVSGGRMGGTQYKADGVNNTSMFLGRVSMAFSTHAIQEVSVQQNAYSAEFGRVGGGVVQMTTKSGSNDVHGTLSSYVQNDALNATPYSNSYRTKGKQRYWKGAMNVGGPVVLPKLYDGRNRSFFFFGYEPKRQSTDTIAYTRVPTELERQGDFSQSFYDTNKNYPVTVFRQFEYLPSGVGLSTTRVALPPNTPYPQFAGNIIPKYLISEKATRLLELIPKANYPTQWDGKNRVESRGVTNTDNRILMKLDQVISDSNRASIRVGYVPTSGERFFEGGRGSLVSSVPSDVTKGLNVAFADTHTFGPNMINEFRLGFSRTDIRRVANDEQLSKNWLQEYGFPSRLDKGMVRLSLNDFQGFATNYGETEVDNILEVNNAFTWIRGRHFIKIGGEFQAPQQNLMNYSPVQGLWDFNSAMTSIGSYDTSKYPGIGVKGARTGFSIASLLLGFPNSVTIARDVVPYQYRWKYVAGYVQDDFKVTPQLTLNLGMRYQFEVPRSEKHHNQGFYVNEKAINSAGREVMGYLQLTGLGGVRNTLFPIRYTNYEPRIGLAYRLPGTGFGPMKVIRSGYGISHMPTNSLFRQATPNLNPKAGQMASNGGQNGGYVNIESNPLALPVGLPGWPSDGKYADLQNIETPVAINPNVSIPYMQQWNFGLGFEFGRNVGLEVNYVGSKGSKLFGPSARFNTINVAQYKQAFEAGYNMGDSFPNPFGITDQNGRVITVSRANMMRSNPLQGSISDAVSQGYNSSYNALQVQLKKRYAMGFQFMVSYTFSKSIDTASCEGQFCADGLGTYSNMVPQLYGGDRALERAVSTFDTPHILRVNYNWDLPFGKGKYFLSSIPGWVNTIVGNWKLSGIGSVQSGKPLLARANTNAGWPDDVGAIRPNINSGVNPINPDWRAHLNDPVLRYASYINVLDLFSAPARMTLGNTPRAIDYIRTPRLRSYDMSIMKDFRFAERVTLQLRGELYDAPNMLIINFGQGNNSLYNNLDYQYSATPVATKANLQTSYANAETNLSNRTVQIGMTLQF